MFETPHTNHPLLTTTASRVIVTVFIVSAVDLLDSPALGYFRDHVINRLLDRADLAHHAVDMKEGFLLPLILIVHIGCAVVIARVTDRHRDPNRRPPSFKSANDRMMPASQPGDPPG
jgi:hypothetical protein